MPVLQRKDLVRRRVPIPEARGLSSARETIFAVACACLLSFPLVGAAPIVDEAIVAAIDAAHDSGNASGLALWTAARLAGDEEVEHRAHFGWDGFDRPLAAMAYDEGMVFVSVSTSSFPVPGEWDTHVVRLAPDGAVLWDATLDFGRVEQGTALARDASGNVIAAGVVRRAGSPSASLASITPEGDVAWSTVVTTSQPISSAGRAAGVAVLPDGSIRVAVGIDATSAPYDYGVELLSFDAGGAFVGARVLSLVGDEVLQGLGVAPDGTLVLTLQTVSGGGGYPVVLIRLDGSGGELGRTAVVWPSVVGRPLDPQWVTSRIAPDGAVWVAGFDQQPEGYTVLGRAHAPWTGWQAPLRGYVAKLDESFHVVWVRHLAFSVDNEVGGFDFHPEGGIVVGGRAEGVTLTRGTPLEAGQAGNDAMFARLSEDGTIAWVRAFGAEPDDHSVWGNEVAVTASGTVWSAGHSYIPGLGYDVFITRAPGESGYAPLTGPLATAMSSATI